jgi:hypothetical protein
MKLNQVAILVLVAASLAMTACANGGAKTDPVPPPASGNWLFIETSTAHPDFPTPTYYRGPLQDANGTVTATLVYSGSSCLPNSPVDFTGNASQNALTLTSGTDNGQVMTITGDINFDGTVVGTYSKPGGGAASCSDDSGTVYGTAVPLLAGNWSGTLSRATNGAINVTAALQQQSTATSDGLYPLTGTVTFANDSCFTSGAIDSTQSYITGEQVVIVATSGASSLTLDGYLINPTLSTAIKITQYSVAGCFTEYGTGELDMRTHAF